MQIHYFLLEVVQYFCLPSCPQRLYTQPCFCSFSFSKFQNINLINGQFYIQFRFPQICNIYFMERILIQYKYNEQLVMLPPKNNRPPTIPTKKILSKYKLIQSNKLYSAKTRESSRFQPEYEDNSLTFSSKNSNPKRKQKHLVRCNLKKRPFSAVSNNINNSEEFIQQQPLKVINNFRQNYGSTSTRDIRILSGQNDKKIKIQRQSYDLRRVKQRNNSVSSMNKNKLDCQRVIQIKKKYKNQLPSISSKNWGIYEVTEGKFIAGKRIQKKRQMASLTKIMNLVTILEILDRRSINPRQIIIPVNQKASKIIGTTAHLYEGDLISLQSLFYGMMLPSGNDAAYQIAIIGGSILKIQDDHYKKSTITSEEIMSMAIKQKQAVIRYLKEMNKIGREVGMMKSKWSNPHGLSNRENVTTVQDMFFLCSYAMKIPKFRKIVSTKNYQCVIETLNNKNQMRLNSQNKLFNSIKAWENTNKMLWEGWSGLKTGITPNAGPCLAASVIKEVNGKNKEYLIILGSCQSTARRWLEVDLLVKWAVLEETDS